MSETLEVRLALSAIWDFIRTQLLDKQVGPYPKDKIIIGTGIAKREPGSIVEISRLDALAASIAWKNFSEGERRALQDPRLGHVIEMLGYLMALESGLAVNEALQFGAWLAYNITGWNGGKNASAYMQRLEQIANQAAFRPAVQAVLNALKKGTPGPPTKTLTTV